MLNRSYAGASAGPRRSRPRSTPSTHADSRREDPVAGGVPWLGVGSDERLSGPNATHETGSDGTVILGSTHGPRLMELLGAAGCC